MTKKPKKRGDTIKDFKRLLKSHGVDLKYAEKFFGSRKNWNEIREWSDMFIKLREQGWDVYPKIISELIIVLKLRSASLYLRSVPPDPMLRWWAEQDL